MTTKREKINKETMRRLEEITGGPLTIGKMLEAHRLSEEISQVEFAEMLGISPSHLCDIEKGRKTVSPERAARFAQLLGLGEQLWIKVSLDDLLRLSQLPYRVKLEDAA